MKSITSCAGAKGLAIAILLGATLISDAFALSEECQTVQACVADQVPQIVSSCAQTTPTCISKSNDRFALTADVLADRAVKRLKCDTKTFKTTRACNICFETAKLPLKSRYNGILFHGMLATAVSIVEDTRKEICAK
jgi:hypothetical protein